MKKSVMLGLIFLTIAVFFWAAFGDTVLTGFQVLDLPSPPPAPGMAFESTEQVSAGASTASGTTGGYSSSGGFVPSVAPAPRLETPATATTAASSPELETKVNDLRSRVDQLSVDVQNLQAQVRTPSVDRPTFTAEVSDIKKSTRTNTILVFSLATLVALLVGGFFFMQHVHKRHEFDEEKEVIGQYLRNYKKQGYDLDTLKEHLRASGWDDKAIDEAEKDMWV